MNKISLVGAVIAVIISCVAFFGSGTKALFGSATYCTDGYTCVTNLETQGNQIVDGSTTLNGGMTLTGTSTSGNLVIPTSNTATSSMQVGCIQTTATSTATPVHLAFTISQTATTTTTGTAGVGFVVLLYGKCPGV